ncbi:MAG: deoxyribonuclease IV [Methanomicrobiales archaeon]|nr:deoxyribonuclease IV [Methanomicrobiales archaeon]
MVRVGVHVSIVGAIGKSVDRAVKKGCDTFQIFSRNPRGWAARVLIPHDAELFIENLHRTKIGPVVDHMPYLPNLATPHTDLYEKSVSTLQAELNRCGMLRVPYLVTHLGHHQGSGKDEGRKRVIEAVNTVFGAVENDVLILLENTAGDRNSVGSTFSDISAVLNGIEKRDRVAVCLDTCHAFAAGYDFRTPAAIAATLKEFDTQVGLDLLRVIHLNDSYGPIGSGLDRHQHIGLGYIGEKGFHHFLHHPAIRDLPLILETPEDEQRDDEGNIAKVRQLAD